MIFSAFFAALGQIGDPRFRRVMGLGVLLSLALLFFVYILALLAVGALAPDTVDLPVIGPVEGLHSLLGWASLFLMLFLSMFLMIPAAAAFAGLFLEDVAAAVEARHWPYLPPPRVLGWAEGLRSSANLIGLIVLVNVIALLLIPFVGVFSPLLFWAVNGFLLGREYFMLVALRRLPQAEARAMRRRNSLTIWAAGALMAAPLSIPLVNLVIPVLGTATFTQLYHRLAQAGR